MERKNKPYININPGRIIKRNLEAMNWNHRDLAEVIGMSEKSISQLVNGKQSITVETAIRLSKAFKTSPEFWLNLEQNFQLRNKKESKKDKETEIKAEIRKYMPILEMKKKGWISCGKTAQSQIQAFLSFWNQEEIDFSVYQPGKMFFCARQSGSDEKYTTYYSMTWFQKARQEARRIRTGIYSRTRLKEVSEKIPEYTMLADGVERFLTQLNKCGVKFFILSHLPKTYLDGASFFDGDNPVIVYTARHDRVDNFWWTVAHEIAHVLCHLKNENDCFLDTLYGVTSKDAKEKEADAFAGKLLKVEAVVSEAARFNNYFTEGRLRQLSKSVSIDCSVVLGILQHHGVVDYRTLSKYKKNVLEMIGGEYKCG